MEFEQSLKPSYYALLSRLAYYQFWDKGIMFALSNWVKRVGESGGVMVA